MNEYYRPLGFVACLVVVAAVGFIGFSTAPSSVPPAMVQPVLVAASASSLSQSWKRYAMDASPVAPGSAIPEKVVRGGPGLLAFSCCSAAASGVPFEWSSVDGHVWKRQQLSSTAFHGIVRLWDVASWHGGVVIAGTAGIRPEQVFWLSPDGITWRRVTVKKFATDGVDSGIRAITAAGPGLVAVGEDDKYNGVVLTSRDGISWHRVSNTNGVFTHAYVTSVAAGGPGVVAVGFSPTAPRIWTSTDGLTWKAVPTEQSGIGGSRTRMDQIIAGRHNLLALGTVIGSVSDKVAWVSTNGVTWKHAQRFEGISSNFDPAGVIAWETGYLSVQEQDGESSLQSSVDGMTWKRDGSDAEFGDTATITGIVPFGNGLAAVGTFAPLPQPYCNEHGTDELSPPAKDTAFVWTPASNQSVPAASSGPLNARMLRLRTADLPPVYSSYSEGGGPGGYYVDLCRFRPSLGQHTAYFNEFQNTGAEGGEVQALGIVTASVPAAQATFRDVDQLVMEEGARVADPTEVHTAIRIGDQTRVFRGAEPSCGDCEGYTYESYTVAWRSGRVLGIAVVAAVHVGPQDLGNALTIARRQFSHLEGTSARTEAVGALFRGEALGTMGGIW